MKPHRILPITVAALLSLASASPLAAPPVKTGRAASGRAIVLPPVVVVGKRIDPNVRTRLAQSEPLGHKPVAANRTGSKS